mgnify:CR=1 FL=1
MEKLKVLVRIRPFIQNEDRNNTGLNIDTGNSQRIEISKSLKKFEATYDKILGEKCTQKDVFNFVKPCLNFIKKGINCTILAYGQTGSGKTYTMFGGEWAMNDKSTDYEQRKKFNKDKYNFILNDELTIDPFSPTNGIIPNLIMSLFQTYGAYNSNGNDIIITCSYIQIYNEQVYDLLIDEEENKEEKIRFNLESRVGRNVNEKPIKQKPLKIKYDKINGVTIDGANEIRTPTFYDIFELLRQGEINRKIRQTNKNEMSSRSHTIFIINIQNLKTNVVSKIKLCDLAGSERYDSGQSYKKLHFNEMCNINKSLLILGNVIHSLGTSNSTINLGGTSKKKNTKTFAPYKDSKLTQILEDSLGGNSVTYLIATISPCDENFEETISTLKFADRAHSITSKVSMNQLTSKDEGYKSKEFNKICDELFQLKQLLNIRKKRGTLEPIQEELLKLKDENSQLKKYLGGGKNVNRIQQLIEENKNLRKEIKNLTEMNKSLKNEINSKPISTSSHDFNNDNRKNNLTDKKRANSNLNIISSKNNNNYNLDDNRNYNINLNNNKYKLNTDSSENLKNNYNINDNQKSDYLNTLNDILTNKANDNNNNNEKKNNDDNYNKYDIDDILDNESNKDNNYNNANLNSNNLNNNYNKYTKPTKNNILKESGQNIIYGTQGMNYNKENKNNELGGGEEDMYDDINYNDLDYDLNGSVNKKNKSKNNINNAKLNPKISKLNHTTSPYERLNLLDQLEMENKKKTQEMIDNLTKNQNKNDDDDDSY